MSEGLNIIEFCKIAKKGMMFRVIYPRIETYPFKYNDIVTFMGFNKEDCRATYCNHKDDKSCKGNLILVNQNGKEVTSCMSWMDEKGKYGDTYLVPYIEFLSENEFEI